MIEFFNFAFSKEAVLRRNNVFALLLHYQKENQITYKRYLIFYKMLNTLFRSDVISFEETNESIRCLANQLNNWLFTLNGNDKKQLGLLDKHFFTQKQKEVVYETGR